MKGSALLNFNCGTVFTSKSIYLDLRENGHPDQKVTNVKMRSRTGWREKGHLVEFIFFQRSSIFYLSPKVKVKIHIYIFFHDTYHLPMRLMITATFPPQLSGRSSHLGTSQRCNIDTRAKKYGIANIHTHFLIFYPF